MQSLARSYRIKCIAKVSKSKDKASSLRAEHVYDAVTSATNNKSKKYGATYTTDGEGTTVYINGVKTAVKINSKLYAAAKAVAASKVTTANKFAEIADSIATVSESLPEEYKTYKTVNADGTLTALKAAEGAGAVDSTSTTATITSTSLWGNYQIDFANMPDDIDTKQMFSVLFSKQAKDRRLPSDTTKIYIVRSRR